MSGRRERLPAERFGRAQRSEPDPRTSGFLGFCQRFDPPRPWGRSRGRGGARARLDLVATGDHADPARPLPSGSGPLQKFVAPRRREGELGRNKRFMRLRLQWPDLSSDVRKIHSRLSTEVSPKRFLLFLLKNLINPRFRGHWGWIGLVGRPGTLNSRFAAEVGTGGGGGGGGWTLGFVTPTTEASAGRGERGSGFSGRAKISGRFGSRDARDPSRRERSVTPTELSRVTRGSCELGAPRLRAFSGPTRL